MCTEADLSLTRYSSGENILATPENIKHNLFHFKINSNLTRTFLQSKLVLISVYAKSFSLSSQSTANTHKHKSHTHTHTRRGLIYQKAQEGKALTLNTGGLSAPHKSVSVIVLSQGRVAMAIGCNGISF